MHALSAPAAVSLRVLVVVSVAVFALLTGCSTPAASETPAAGDVPDAVAATTAGGGAQDARPVLITFTKPGCPACLKLAPILAGVAAEYQSTVRFEEINTDIAKQLVFDHLITGTPTVIIFVDGKEAQRMINPKEDVLRDAIEAVLSSKG